MDDHPITRIHAVCRILSAEQNYLDGIAAALSTTGNSVLGSKLARCADRIGEARDLANRAATEWSGREMSASLEASDNMVRAAMAVAAARGE
jgi:hypothetical protein